MIDSAASLVCGLSADVAASPPVWRPLRRCGGLSARLAASPPMWRPLRRCGGRPWGWGGGWGGDSLAANCAALGVPVGQGSADLPAQLGEIQRIAGCKCDGA